MALAAAAHPSSPSPLVSVSELTPITTFGGDIVRIKAGPGGDFGNGLYAISRGAGDNSAIGAINRPGVIYRVDPATGKASVFFDLNTVLSQLEPGGNASNGLGVSTGLQNWYDITFDREGYFDGRPSMFVSSVSSTDPFKNGIFRIAPDGSFLGFFTQETQGASARITRAPSAILVPPTEQQSFLRGLIAGSGLSDPNTGFDALFFNANAFTPGQNVTPTSLPAGVAPLPGFNLGPQVGFTAANSDYVSPDYSGYTNFGTPAGGGIPAAPGQSGLQGIGGDLPIGSGAPGVFPPLNTTNIDLYPSITSDFRRIQDVAFDQYGYFSYGFPTTVAAGVVTFTQTTTPIYAGSLFASDLGTGLSVAVTPTATGATPVLVPVQGPGTVTIVSGAGGNTITRNQANLGGRIVRIAPNGLVTPFAAGFHTSGAIDSTSFVGSELSITFSADGTTIYASDDDAIWQFKTVASLAGSTSGSIIGLNDLRTLGVPYDGSSSAVAILDTGVDALTPQFRGRVAPGTNVLTNGAGSQDNTPGTTGTGGVGSVVPVTGGGGGAAGAGDINGHGTLVAGVISQFVTQSTLVPTNIFASFLAGTGTITGQTSIQPTTNDAVYNGLGFIANNPFVKDPIRPDAQGRVVAASIGFGTVDTFNSEGVAFKKFPQVVIAFKNQMKRLRDLGIAPVAAAGQFGQPVGTFSQPVQGLPSGTSRNSPFAGDVNGMTLPAVLNEAISVTGTYSFPFSAGAQTPPTNPTIGVVPRPVAPILVSALLGTATGGTPPPATGNANSITALTSGDGSIFADKIITSSNRNSTTDFAAPEVNIPTFRRTFVGDGAAHNVFNEGGTSLSAGIVTGSIALVASAIDYWSTLNRNGVSASAYLNTPVGVNTLNFGPHAFADLTAYSNPDAINAILQWTASPTTDQDTGGDVTAAPQLIGSTNFRQFSRISISNAIAAIEGTEAINYLLDHGTFNIIDGNHNGLITAQEVQTFVDQSKTIGLPEAGAMARLLGGTARSAGNGFTALGEQPDQPDVLARRFNFFDFAANGKLLGAISIDSIKALSHKLLPAPDAFVTVDRQRSSISGYLLNPTALRNYSNLQHLKPTYEFVPKSAVARYRNISPARFKVNKGLNFISHAPVYTLFAPRGGNTAVSNAQSAQPQTPTTPSPVTPANNAAGTSTSSSQSQSPGNGTTPTSTTPTSQGTTTATTTTPTTQGTTSNNSSNQDSTNQANAVVTAINQLIAKSSPQPAQSKTASTPAATQGSSEPKPAGTVAATSPAQTPAATTPAATTPTASTIKSSTATTAAKTPGSPTPAGTTAAAKTVKHAATPRVRAVPLQHPLPLGHRILVTPKAKSSDSTTNKVLSSFLGVWGNLLKKKK